MARIKCSNCGAKISDRATACVKCECPTGVQPATSIKILNIRPRSTTPTNKAIVIAVIGTICVGAIIAFLVASGKTDVAEMPLQGGIQALAPIFEAESDKAQTAEAPFVIAIFELAFLAAVAESDKDPSQITESEVDFGFDSLKKSKWWTYSFTRGGTFTATTTSKAKLGKAKAGATLTSAYNANEDCFHRTIHQELVQMIPDFASNDCPAINASKAKPTEGDGISGSNKVVPESNQTVNDIIAAANIKHYREATAGFVLVDEDDWLNLRPCPLASDDCKPIATAELGTVLIVLGESGDGNWYKVKYGNIIAFASSRFISGGD